MLGDNPGKGIRVIGYSPWRFTAPDGKQGLVQIFIDSDGVTDVQVCYRAFSWDTWGAPHQAERA